MPAFIRAAKPFEMGMLTKFRSPLTGILLAASLLAAFGGELAAQPKAKTNARRTRDVSQFRRQHAERRAKFASGLEELAQDCDRQGLELEADQIRTLAAPLQVDELRLAPLPRDVQGPIPGDLSPEERGWRQQLRFARQEYAKDLYQISRMALKNGHVGLAYDLVREVAINDPDHVSARRILGFVRSGDEWLTAFEAKMLKEKMVWHDSFGWILKEHVERYEKGERFYRNNWMSSAKEAVLRQEFTRAWEVRTEHYLVRTNHSLERGVELAKKLEDFHGLFFQFMAGFFNTPDQVKQLFDGSSARPQVKARAENVVHYYRTRDEYLQALRALKTNQRIEITRGMYFPSSRIAYFYFDPQVADESTVYHEATHQLLSGSRPMAGEIGIKANFWVIEGIACYMESFQHDGERFSVGDPGHVRLQAARYHFVEDGYYVRLKDFTRMGMANFQKVPEPQIGMNYSQGAALSHFFMHYDDGRYREAFIEHISQIYSPNKSPDSLEELTGVTADELDKMYAEHIRSLLTPSPPPVGISNVTDELVPERGEAPDADADGLGGTP